MEPADANADPAVGESIVGCVRLLTHRHLPTLRTWLDVFVKVCCAIAASTTGRSALSAVVHGFHSVFADVQIVLQVVTGTGISSLAVRTCMQQSS